jgi:hypothetical protein
LPLLVAAFAFVFLAGVLVGAGIAITSQQRRERREAIKRMERRFDRLLAEAQAQDAVQESARS